MDTKVSSCDMEPSQVVLHRVNHDKSGCIRLSGGLEQAPSASRSEFQEDSDLQDAPENICELCFVVRAASAPAAQEMNYIQYSICQAEEK